MAKYMSGKDCVVLQGGVNNVKPVADFVLKDELGSEVETDSIPRFALVDGEGDLGELGTRVRFAMDGTHLYTRDKDDNWKRLELTALAG